MTGLNEMNLTVVLQVELTGLQVELTALHLELQQKIKQNKNNFWVDIWMPPGGRLQYSPQAPPPPG